MTQPRRARTQAMLAAVAVAALLVGGACSSSSSASGDHGLVRVGQSLPDATVTTYAGTQVGLHSLHGRALVLNFWARSCAPCAEEMPTLEASYRTASGQIGFLGVDASEPESVGQPFARRLGVSYALAADPQGTLVAQLGVSSLPTTVFVDARGVVRGVHVGRLSAAALASGLRAIGPR
jgi:cytochrome c biogenesis protein CcmG, thiol:disulfide interchange protein DsbE